MATVFLLQSPSPIHWLEQSVSVADEVINKLQSLIHLLMETPVGLKLNQPLNSILGNFFLYHIYLLRTYMSVLKPLYASISQVICCFGFFGLTCLLSVLCDLFSLATIHIYCFYGYASRLYNIQAHGLTSMWRLFRGKKWNPLRNRVDSYSHSNDQLFMGSLCFTILLFLLPTVFVYYSVFLLLRLMTMGFLSILRITMTEVSLFPLYSFILRVFSSNKLSSGIKFVFHGDQVTMKSNLLSFTELSQTPPSFLRSSLQTRNTVKLRQLLTDILWGNIICPI